MEVKQVKCDNCGKVSEKYLDFRTLNGWFRLLSIRLNFRPVRNRKSNLSDKNMLKISDKIDSDFCSKKCLMEWFEEKVDDISRK